MMTAAEQCGRGDIAAKNGNHRSQQGKAGAPGSLAKPSANPAPATAAGKAGQIAARGVKTAQQAVRVGKAVSRPLTAQTTAGKAGQIAARGAFVANRTVSTVNRVVRSPEMQEAAFRAGQVTGQAVRTAARLERAAAGGIRRALGRASRKLSERRGFGSR